MRRFVLGLVLCISLVVGAGATAQQPDVPIVGVADGVLTIFGPDANTRIGDDSPFYFDVAASPDGAFIAYTAFQSPEDSSPTLTLLPVTGATPPVDITQEVATEFPLAFGPNGQFLYYVRPGTMSEEQPMQFTMEIMRQDVRQTNTDSQVVASFPYSVGCGGGSPYPMDAAYWIDTALNGNPMLLTVTPVGMVHSIACNGVGVGLTSLESGETTILSEEIGRGSLSADGTQFAGARIVFAETRLLTELVIIDLTDGSLISTQTENMPDQIHWGADGRLYYTTRTPADKDYGLSADQAQTFQDNTGIATGEIPSYEASIYRYNIVTGQSEPIYSTTDVWAISRMDSTPTTLYFSQVPDATPWLDALFSDESGSDSALAAFDALVRPDVYRLPLDGGAAEQLVDGVQLFGLAG